MSVDIKGFYLICLNKITKVRIDTFRLKIRRIIQIFFFKESECFDIALIHDTRTGSEASLPRVKSKSIQFKYKKESVIFRVLLNVSK